MQWMNTTTVQRALATKISSYKDSDSAEAACIGDKNLIVQGQWQCRGRYKVTLWQVIPVIVQLILVHEISYGDYAWNRSMWKNPYHNQIVSARLHQSPRVNPIVVWGLYLTGVCSVYDCVWYLSRLRILGQNSKVFGKVRQNCTILNRVRHCDSSLTYYVNISQVWLQSGNLWNHAVWPLWWKFCNENSAIILWRDFCMVHVVNILHISMGSK